MYLNEKLHTMALGSFSTLLVQNNGMFVTLAYKILRVKKIVIVCIKLPRTMWRNFETVKLWIPNASGWDLSIQMENKD